MAAPSPSCRRAPGHRPPRVAFRPHRAGPPPAPRLPGEPWGIYVHIPFCEAKCHYCDFNSHAFDGDTGVSGVYLAALLQEAAGVARELEAGRLFGRPVDPPPVFSSLFVGGGTPTTLSAGQLRRLLTHLLGLFSFTPDREVTVEANPGTVDEARLTALLEGGMTRLSLGAQSFDSGFLRLLGRQHSPEDVALSVRLARRAGVDNLNLDLISAIPGQTLEGWADTLELALALEPDHLSCYTLTFEEGTPFYTWWRNGRLARVDEEAELAMFLWTSERLHRAGFVHYEISNFARPGRWCRHNVLYWQSGNWLGLGCGAHAHVAGVRVANVAAPSRYVRQVLAGAPHARVVEESPDEAMDTAMMLGLRLAAGVDGGRFASRFGRRPEAVYGDAVARLARRRLVSRAGGRLRLTARGLPLANYVARSFLRPAGA